MTASQRKRAVSGVQLVEMFGTGSGYWGAIGTLTAIATIYNIAVEVFPVGPDGLHTYPDFIEGAAFIAPPAAPEKDDETIDELYARKYEAKQALRVRQLARAKRFAASR